eukprot:GFYU01002766.1.p1 GENE.GFYU01002766.1~~GFYU01002766.1.p1  ORF type:complete len:307 (-),score=59.19 GFYU01002766.1:300-1142(-)
MVHYTTGQHLQEKSNIISNDTIKSQPNERYQTTSRSTHTPQNGLPAQQVYIVKPGHYSRVNPVTVDGYKRPDVDHYKTQAERDFQAPAPSMYAENASKGYKERMMKTTLPWTNDSHKIPAAEHFKSLTSTEYPIFEAQAGRQASAADSYIHRRKTVLSNDQFSAQPHRDTMKTTNQSIFQHPVPEPAKTTKPPATWKGSNPITADMYKKTTADQWQTSTQRAYSAVKQDASGMNAGMGAPGGQAKTHNVWKKSTPISVDGYKKSDKSHWVTSNQQAFLTK